MKTIGNIGSFIYGGLYLILSDFVRPGLVDTGNVSLWWIIVALFLLPVYVWIASDLARKKISNIQIRSRIIALTLLTAVVVLWDPIIKNRLRPFGLAQLWIAAAVALLFWGVDGSRHFRRKSSHVK